jgi:hypothetical protein
MIDVTDQNQLRKEKLIATKNFARKYSNVCPWANARAHHAGRHITRFGSSLSAKQRIFSQYRTLFSKDHQCI